MRPLDAALKGAGEIGFTIVSISVSLIAVFIPLLLMGGIVGRLLHEFAMTVSMAVVISAFVSLTLTPMMCARFLRQHQGRHGRLYRIIEAGFDAMIGFYARTLDVALRFRAITLDYFHRHPVPDRRAVLDHSEGLLPDPGYRPDPRHHRSQSGHHFDAMIAAPGSSERRSCTRSRGRRFRLACRRRQ